VYVLLAVQSYEHQSTFRSCRVSTSASYADTVSVFDPQLLHKEGLYESNEEATQREEVLGQLDRILKDWVKSVARKRSYPETTIAEANATMFTFGSYRLGVHGPGKCA
jgi:poly(A) polymerase Pap1